MTDGIYLLFLSIERFFLLSNNFMHIHTPLTQKFLNNNNRPYHAILCRNKLQTGEMPLLLLLLL